MPTLSLANQTSPSTATPGMFSSLHRDFSQTLRLPFEIWQNLPRAWWVMPCAGLGLLMLLASGIGLVLFVGKYAWTGKDFQEVLGPSILASAVAVAMYLWAMQPNACRMWMMCLPAALLCRELHFAGTGTGIYVALVAILVYAVRRRELLAPVWNCRITTCLWLGAISWYVLAVSIDSGAWKFLPHSHWWSVNLEETMESCGHLAILLGILGSVTMVVQTPAMRYNRVSGAVDTARVS